MGTRGKSRNHLPTENPGAADEQGLVTGLTRLHGFTPGEMAAAQETATRLMANRQACESLRQSKPSTSAWADTFQAIQARYGSSTQSTILETCRNLRPRLGFIDSWLSLKADFVLEGLQLAGPGGDALNEAFPSKPWVRLARDLAKEYFTVANTVSSWWIAMPGNVDGRLMRLPLVQDTESISFDDPGGVEMVRPTKTRRMAKHMNELIKSMLEQRQAQLKAGEKDGWIRLRSDDEEKYGERFFVASTGKRGTGYGTPPLYALFFDLCLLETIRLGDMNGAQTMKDVMRKISMGHEIKYGPMAGQPTYFLKRNDINTINETLADKLGAFDFVARHDLNVEFPHLDPEFFSQKKYDPVWQRITEWAGPLFRALSAGAGEAGEIAMRAWRVEGNRHREFLQRALEDILNDAEFAPGITGPSGKRVTVRFSPLSFMTHKEGREWTNFLLSNGLASPQTVQELYGLNSEEEQRRLQQAHQNPESFRPAFEPRQGLLQPDNQGGRPASESSTENE